MPKCGIYKITNQVNQKSYIGQSTDIIGRWRHHKASSKNTLSAAYDYPLQKAFRKYGIDNFKFEIIEECLKKDLDAREQYWIDFYDTLGVKGYNQVLVRQGGTKITPKIVLEVIELLKTTEMSTEDIGKEFDISGRTVRSINTGESWYDESLDYPIRKKGTHQEHLCVDCGKPTSGAGYLRCSACASKARIVPLEKMLVTREELKELIRTTPFTTIGKRFGMNDNSIRKWCDKFNLPRTKKIINSYSDEEWANI